MTQWDQNQTLIFKNLGLSSAPEFHFCNKNSTEAYNVSSTIDSDGDITVEVPNILLEECETIIAYIYAYYNSSSAKTIGVAKIPIIPKPQPVDYQYVENVGYDSVSAVIDEIMGIINSITKNSLGLGNVDNTADADKTVSHTSTADNATEADSVMVTDKALKLETVCKIDGIDFDGTANAHHFGWCQVGQNTPEKSFTVDNLTELKQGTSLIVLFTDGVAVMESPMRFIINGVDTGIVKYQGEDFMGPLPTETEVKFMYDDQWYIVGDMTQSPLDDVEETVDIIEPQVEELEEEFNQTKVEPYETLWTGMSTGFKLKMEPEDGNRVFMVEGGYSSDGVNISGMSINDSARRGRVVFFLAPDYLPDIGMESGTYRAHDSFVHAADYTGDIDMFYSSGTMEINTYTRGGPDFYISRITILR